MKFLKYLIFSMFLATSCATHNVVKMQPQATANGSRIVKFVQNGREQEVTLSKEEYDALYRLASRYVAIRELVLSNKIDKNTKITKIDNETYLVQVNLDDKLAVIVKVTIDKREIDQLKLKLKRLSTAKPTVETIRIDDTKFKITMSIDDISWSTTINVENVKQQWSWNTFLWGSVVGVPIGIILKKYILVFFLL